MLALASSVAPQAAGAAGWSFQAAVGFPFDFSLPVTIRQGGEAPIRVSARWETRPFESPLYYDLRVARWSGGSEWSVDLLHHKLYLTNPPPEVQELGISHGFNLLFVSHAREVARDTWARVGAGLVVAHPESIVRGRRFEGAGPFGGGYYPAGPTLVAGAERRFFPAGGLFVSLQALATASWVRVPVAGGSASMPDLSVHALGGLGFASGQRRRGSRRGARPQRRRPAVAAAISTTSSAEASGISIARARAALGCVPPLRRSFVSSRANQRAAVALTRAQCMSSWVGIGMADGSVARGGAPMTRAPARRRNTSP